MVSASGQLVTARNRRPSLIGPHHRHLEPRHVVALQGGDKGVHELGCVEVVEGDLSADRQAAGVLQHPFKSHEAAVVCRHKASEAEVKPGGEALAWPAAFLLLYELRSTSDLRAVWTTLSPRRHCRHRS